MTSELRVDKIHNEGGDNDSGLDMSTNDVVAVKIAGSEKVRIHSDGNVGIGTTSPAADLTIKTASTEEDAILIEQSDGTDIGSISVHGGAFKVQGKSATAPVQIQTVDGNEDIEVDPDGFIKFETAGTEKMRIKASNIELGAQTFQDGVNVAGDYAFKVHNDGNNSNRYALYISGGADDASGTNYAIGIKDGDGGDQGFVTFSGGTVTYGAFTAHHEISLPDADKANGYPYGTLLETTAIYYTQKDGSDTERGIRYVTQKSSSQYSRKVLGTYCGDMLEVADSSGTYANNLHQAAVLGDGHILCNNSGGNIKIGDGICSSATAGIGQKADKLCMIMGIAQKDITFSGSETVLVPVQYGLQQFTPWTD